MNQHHHSSIETNKNKIRNTTIMDHNSGLVHLVTQMTTDIDFAVSDIHADFLLTSLEAEFHDTKWENKYVDGEHNLISKATRYAETVVRGHGQIHVQKAIGFTDEDGIKQQTITFDSYHSSVYENFSQGELHPNSVAQLLDEANDLLKTLDIDTHKGQVGYLIASLFIEYETLSGTHDLFDEQTHEHLTSPISYAQSVIQNLGSVKAEESENYKQIISDFARYAAKQEAPDVLYDKMKTFESTIFKQFLEASTIK